MTRESTDFGRNVTPQFGRALFELSVDILCANSSQAKGRVERANLTLQDRPRRRWTSQDRTTCYTPMRHNKFDTIAYPIDFSYAATTLPPTASADAGNCILGKYRSMKKWADNHPKAKLMAEKRAAILSAAHRAFLASGYERTSMEAIAAAAGVSIMTLYRHARTKDDLFEAVLSQACEPAAGSDDARIIETILQKPLVDILTFIATRFRDRLTRPETLGLLRAVMVEHQHFPHLGQLAFEGLVASHVRRMAAFIATRPEAEGVEEAQRAQLSVDYFDQLLGTGQLRALLGLPIDGAENDPALPRRVAKRLIEGLRNTEVQGSEQ